MTTSRVAGDSLARVGGVTNFLAGLRQNSLMLHNSTSVRDGDTLSDGPRCMRSSAIISWADDVDHSIGMEGGQWSRLSGGPR